MPAAYAHLIFGRHVLSSLPDGGLKEAILPHRELFEIGLQGPDILFFYHPLTHPPLNRVGHTLHDKSAISFLDRPVCRHATGGALAYLLGFICHYALDSVCHTSVEYYMEKTGKGHSKIETELERVLMLDNGIDPYRCYAASYIRNRREYAHTIAPFYNTNGHKIHEALTTMKLVGKFLVPSSSFKHALLTRIGRRMGENSVITELTMDRTPDPAYKESSPELIAAMGQAVPVAHALMESFFAWNRGEGTLSHRFRSTFSFDTDELARRKERDLRV